MYKARKNITLQGGRRGMAAIFIVICVGLMAGCAVSDETTVEYRLKNTTGGTLRIEYVWPPEADEPTVHILENSETLVKPVLSDDETEGLFCPSRCVRLINEQNKVLAYCQGGQEKGNLLVPSEWTQLDKNKKKIILYMSIENTRFAESTLYQIDQKQRARCESCTVK